MRGNAVQAHPRVSACVLLLSLLGPAACWGPDEPVVREAPPREPVELPTQAPAGARPEQDAPRPPIPPLEGAERPSESPLNELTDEIIDPALEDPVFRLPILEAETEADAADASEARPPGDDTTLPDSASGASALDLDELTERLRKTEALGLFTKVSLKNQIDDLTDALRRYHKKGRGRIEALRERYDGLVLKIMGLIQDEEPVLARDIARSRETLWAVLASREEFLALMGGRS